MLLSMMLLLPLCGCSQQVQETTGKTIELIEPVNVSSNTEEATFRTIYSYKVYSATVYPTIKEYSFEEATEVQGKGAFWGEEVKKGAALIYGNEKKIDEEIENKEKEIADKATAMQEAEAEYKENMAEKWEKEKWLAGVADAYEKIEPPKQVKASELQGTVSDGDANAAEEDKMVDNPAYANWEKEANPWIGQYRILAHSNDMDEESFRQKKELYDLEYAYDMKVLESLKKDKKKLILTSDGAGEVVAKVPVKYGSYSAKEEESVIAVGDRNEKVLITDYINKTDIGKAKEVYATIDGVRYEVEYHPMDSDEYKKITADGGKAYTTFSLLGDTQQVNVGDYAVVTVFSEKREQVLSVPKIALHKSDTGFFVYVIKDGESVSVPVKTGISDGVYTEIVSGLEQGDAVLVDALTSYSNKTVTPSYGSFNSTFEGAGAMEYALSENVKNPIKNGTTYFGEYQVDEYQHVEKGDVIATIRVMKDEYVVKEKQIQLQRAQERLADLKAEGAEENKKAIEERLERIAEINEELTEILKDAETTEIKAPMSGTIINLSSLETERILRPEEIIGEIAKEEACYAVVENTNQMLNYGNEVKISYMNREGKTSFCNGVVVSASNPGLTKALQSENAYISLPKESLGDMALYNATSGNWWNRYIFRVEATTREMNHVLVIPRTAVTEINGCTYVNVKDKQGKVTTRSFVAGGYDNTNYWVIEGLSEGMELCLK